MGWKTGVMKRRLNERASRNFYIGAIDTETNGLDGELICVTYHHELWAKPRITTNMSSFIDAMINGLELEPKTAKKTIWFSHNGMYDWRYMLPYFMTSCDVELKAFERAPGKIFQLKAFRDGAEIFSFRDSLAIFPQSLSKFTAMFSDVKKQDIGLGEGVVFDIKNSEHVEYALNDAIGLTKAVMGFDDTVYKTYGVHIRGTVPSTSYQACLRSLEPGFHNRVCDEAERFFREGYYGGMVKLNCFASRPYCDVDVYDISSSYPAQMRKGVPKGKPAFTHKFMKDKPGFYRCVVTAPKGTFTYIPHRSQRGEISFPTGTFETVITSIEIEHAKLFGYRFKILEGYYFPEGINLCFNAFVDKCEKLRTAHKGTALEMVAKLMQNSLYGKFATRKEGREVSIVFSDLPQQGKTSVIDPDTGLIIPFLFYEETERDSEYMLPHYAAWITANARLALAGFCLRTGVDLVLYTDTDSAHLQCGAKPPSDLIGADYGLFKHEKVLEEIKYHAPKCYTYIEKGKPGLKAVYKGIPEKVLKSNDVLKQRLHNGERIEVEYHSSNNVDAFLKTGSRYVIRKRSSTSPDNIYGHKIIDGFFYPRHFA